MASPSPIGSSLSPWGFHTHFAALHSILTHALALNSPCSRHAALDPLTFPPSSIPNELKLHKGHPDLYSVSFVSTGCHRPHSILPAPSVTSRLTGYPPLGKGTRAGALCWDLDWDLTGISPGLGLGPRAGSRPQPVLDTGSALRTALCSSVVTWPGWASFLECRAWTLAESTCRPAQHGRWLPPASCQLWGQLWATSA